MCVYASVSECVCECECVCDVGGNELQCITEAFEASVALSHRWGNQFK